MAQPNVTRAWLPDADVLVTQDLRPASFVKAYGFFQNSLLNDF
jgi:hypothetical protein